MSEWQPIETAPKDASVFIYVPNAEHYGEGIYRAILSSMFNSWTTFGLHVGRAIGTSYQPTHWMPLPAAPNAEQRDDHGVQERFICAKCGEGYELVCLEASSAG